MTAPLPQNPARRHELLAGCAFVLWLVFAGLALSRGLTGEFIFDDSWNLRGLEDIQHDPTWQTAFHYIITGIASQTGRPLALATFAAQYLSWPGYPEDFIWVNIGLHLLNGALLGWALVSLLRLRGAAPDKAVAVGLLAAVLWVLTPLNASAVLYIVQRMAVLAGTCMFTGLLLYVKGRQRALDGRPYTGLALMSLGVGVGTVLGLMTKENAALFPLMLIVLEATVLAGQPRPPYWPLWRGIFLWLPLAGLVAALIYKSPGIFDSGSRNFTDVERCLTEGRVLFMYVQKLVLPSLFSIRLLYDDLEVSRSLFTPWTTLPALVAWAAAVVLALRHRRRHPLAAFGLLWFLVCHLLESTAIPLELAFEHRNYVASAAPLLALAAGIVWLAESPRFPRARPAIVAGAAAYVALFGLALWHTASLWGDPSDLAAFWAKRQPDSKRAQYQFADNYFRNGLPGHASLVYESMAARWPGDPAILVSELEIACYYPDAPKPSMERLADSLRRFDGHVYATINMMDRVVRAAEEKRCHRFPAPELLGLVDKILATPAFQPQRHNVLLLRARISASAGDLKGALASIDESLALRPVIMLAIQGVIWSMQQGNVAGVQHYLDIADHDPRIPGLDRWTYREWLTMIHGWVDEQEQARRKAAGTVRH